MQSPSGDFFMRASVDMSQGPWIYRPQSVRIPEDAGVKRDVKVNSMSWGVRKGRPVDAQARSQYDADTLFYDMFFASGVLTCIGPPFINLGAPESILCDGERLRFKEKEVTSMTGHVRLRIEVPAQKKGRERLDLRFCFSDFEVPTSCDMRRASPPSLPHRDLCLVTVQKENPAQWIRDWLLWHCRAHGVGRAIIYDNGSRDFPELGGAFSDLDADLDVALVHWPFPYGPIHSYWNKFCQNGALNHFHLFFGGSFDWGVNLDIDEYLFAEGERTLAERLRRLQRRRQPAMYLGQRSFPREALQQGRTPRFFHYRMRYREKHCKLFLFPKYIFQPGQAPCCGVHYIYFRGAGGPLQIVRRLLQVVHRLRLKIFKKRNISLRLCLQPVLPPYFDKKLRENGGRALFFCHYKGLNTGWKAGGNRASPYPGSGGEVSEIAPELLIEDRRMAERAAELGFRDAEEGSGDASKSPPAGGTADA